MTAAATCPATGPSSPRPPVRPAGRPPAAGPVAAVGPAADTARLAGLGLDPGLESAYLAALERPSWTVPELAERLSLDVGRTGRVAARLVDLRLVGTGGTDGDRLRPINPQIALTALVAEQEAALARAGRDLETTRLAAADIAVDFAGHLGVRVDTARSPAAARSTVETLVRTATTEIVALSATCHAGADPLGAAAHLDPRALRPGVRCRAVFPDAARVDPTLSRRLMQFTRDGGSVRTGPTVPVHALIVDGAVLALPADGHAHSGVSVLRLAGAVVAALELFERIWQTATPLKVSAPVEVGGLGQRERDLLALLADGATDESAAVRLGVSVRTVRRMVSDLMGRLGARSRFQAGRKAAERGWLA